MQVEVPIRRRRYRTLRYRLRKMLYRHGSTLVPAAIVIILSLLLVVALTFRP